MYGRNSISKLEHGDGERLRIVDSSPFLTIQGEGPYTGHPAVFLRLHGCHLRCHFCDTNFDDPTDPVLSKYEIVKRIMEVREYARLVVITGGEPMRQNILPLCERLWIGGFKVQIETAGNFWINDITDFAEIVCSPKTPVIHPKILEHASAFKYVISASDPDTFDFNQPYGYVPFTSTQGTVTRKHKLALPREEAPVYLSPCDEANGYMNKVNLRMVAALALRFNVIAGVQLHKIMELP